jgi:hypothetical protein
MIKEHEKRGKKLTYFQNRKDSKNNNRVKRSRQ